MRRLLTAAAAVILVAQAIWALDGSVVVTQASSWFGKGAIVRIDLPSKNRTTIDAATDCFGPCFSPDGDRVVYARGGSIWIANRDGSNKVNLNVACDNNREPAMNWVRLSDGDYIYWSEQGTQVYRVKLGTTVRQTVFTGAGRIYMVSVNSTATRGACSRDAWSVWGLDIAGNSEHTYGGGCQGTISPNGNLITHNLGSHTEAVIHQWKQTSAYRTITTPYGKFNKHRFSKHSNDYVVFCVCNDDGGANPQAYVCNINDNSKVACGAGDPWDFFPGTPITNPRLCLNKAELQFTAEEGGNNPAVQTVVVENCGGGTLGDVTVSEDAPWLTVTRSGSGNSQSLTNSVNISGLTSGNYSAIVTVSGGGAATSAQYSVRLQVRGSPVLSSITVAPSSATLRPGGTLQLTATAHDQNGTPFPTVITWTVSSHGTVSPSSSGSPVSSHTTTFTSDGTKGSAIIIASSQGISDTAVISIATIHLKINCGVNTINPPGWEQEDSYVTGGAEYVFAQAADPTGVPNAGPADIYRSCRHLSPHTYVFPVPNGMYTVRLHIVVNSTERSFTYVCEGDTLEKNWNPLTQAGGIYKVLVKDYQVAVRDGDGLRLHCTSAKEDVFECAIEVIEYEAVMPMYTLKAPLGGETFRVGDTLWVRWESNPALATDAVLMFSPDGGDNFVLMHSEAQLTPADPRWGNFPWLIPPTVTLENGQVVPVGGSRECLIVIKQYIGTARVQSGLFAVQPVAVIRQHNEKTQKTIEVLQLQRQNRLHVLASSNGQHELEIVDSRGATVLRLSPHACGVLELPPGIYLIRVRAPGSTQKNTVVLVR